jgi:hypothetical protein
VSWQDFIETTKSESIPNYFDRICQTISAPKYRLLTSLSLSLILAGLSVGLRALAEPFCAGRRFANGTKIEPIDSLSERLHQRVENLAIDLLSQFQPSDNQNIILLKPPLRVLGELNNPQTLTAALKKIEQNAKPQAFLTDSNLARYLPATSPQRQWKLNDRVFDRSTFITTESISELSSAQLKYIFNGKIIVIGDRDTLTNKPLTAVGVASLQENRIDLNLNLNLLKVQSKSEEFIWIFVWCNLSIFIVWQMSCRLFMPTMAVVGSQTILGGVLLMGNGMPIVITSIAIISAGTIVFKVNPVSLQHQS